MRGKLSEISIAGFLKMLHEGAQSGRLSLRGKDGDAELYFAEGRLEGLNLSGLVSADGAYDVFRWRDGDFELALGEFPPPPGLLRADEGFFTRAEDYEKRWAALARVPVEAMTVVTRAAAPPEAPRLTGDRARLLDAVAGGGITVAELARKLGRGLTVTAEAVAQLYELGAVTLESPTAPDLGPAIAALLHAALDNYEIFAGKILAKKLRRELNERARQLGLGVLFDEKKVNVGIVREADVPLWLGVIETLLAETAGPVGGEVAQLLWQKAVASVPAPLDAVVANYRLDFATSGVKGGQDE